jgi:hypothetical protein
MNYKVWQLTDSVEILGFELETPTGERHYCGVNNPAWYESVLIATFLFEVDARNFMQEKFEMANFQNVDVDYT